jgi:large subunit ribosomal protein L3
MKALLGKKISMTRIFDKSGKVYAVTAVEAGPCAVTQIKKVTNDGYNAVQIGYDTTKKLNKPQKGHLKAATKNNSKLDKIKFLNEFEINEKDLEDIKIGDEIKADIFKEGDEVEVSGNSKGKGYQGTVKRHNFTTGPKSHGSDNYRQPGSIGATYPQRVIKGRRMSGHMGNERVTIKGLKVIDVIAEKNILLISGAIPGIKGSLISIKGVKNG